MAKEQGKEKGITHQNEDTPIAERVAGPVVKPARYKEVLHAEDGYDPQRTAAWWSEYERRQLVAGAAPGPAGDEDDEDSIYWKAVEAKGEQTCPEAPGPVKRGRGGRKKRVDQVDKRGRICFHHLSMTDAAKSVHVHPSVMCTAIRERQYLKGYTWQYTTADDSTKETQNQALTPACSRQAGLATPVQNRVEQSLNECCADAMDEFKSDGAAVCALHMPSIADGTCKTGAGQARP